jgi:hypothetical protein
MGFPLVFEYTTTRAQAAMVLATFTCPEAALALATATLIARNVIMGKPGSPSRISLLMD